MPETYETGQGGKGVVRKPKQPIHQAPKKPGQPGTPSKPTPTGGPTAEDIADATSISAVRMREAFHGVREETVYHLPDTLTYLTGTKNDNVLASAADEYLGFVAQNYGGENLGALFGAEAITDPEIRDNVIEALNYTRNLTYGSTPYVPGASLARKYTDDELAQMAMSGADLSQLPPTDMARMKGIADDLLAAVQELPDTGVATESLQKAVMVAATGDLSYAITADQVNNLSLVQEAFGRLGGLRQTAETPELASIGIEQVSQRGGHTIVFMEEWAKAHPEEAFAVKLALQADFPDLNIEFGADRGIPGWILNKFGASVDLVTAPFTAGIAHLNEWGESVVTSPEDRARSSAAADELEKALAEGKVPQDKVEETLSAITHLRDDASIDVGMDDFTENVFRNANPQAIGMGAADTLSKAAGIYPGDPEYGLFYGSMALITNIVADPTTYITAGWAAFRHAQLIPEIGATAKALPKLDDLVKEFKLADETLDDAAATAMATKRLEDLARAEVTKTLPRTIGLGWLRNNGYQFLKKSPEKAIVSKPWRRAVDTLWTIKQRFNDDDLFAAFLAKYQTDAKGIGGRALGGDTNTAAFIAGAQSKDDLAWSLVAVQTGPGGQLPKVAEMQGRLTDVTRQLDELAQAGAPLDEALVAERAWLNSALNGRDWVRPMTQTFSRKNLRQLRRRAKEATPEGDVLESAKWTVEQLPDEVIAKGHGAIAKYVAANPEVDLATRSLFQRWKDLWKPTSFGELVVLPGTSGDARALRRTLGVDDVIKKLRLDNPALSRADARLAARQIVADSKRLADVEENSFGYLVNIGRTLGIPEARITELMKPWAAAELGTPAKNYQFITRYWETVISESPKLRASDKVEASRMWDTLVGDRRTTELESIGPSGFTNYEPVWYKTVVDETTGKATPMPVPSYAADQFQTWRAPSMDKMHEYLSHVQRTMKQWRNEGGWARFAVANTHYGLSAMWHSWTSLWKFGALGTRVTALPLRIVTEENIRAAALGQFSAVWRPIEMFASTKQGVRLFPDGDMAMLTDDIPSHALGAAVVQMAENPNWQLAKQGKTQIRLAEEEYRPAFFRSYSERMSRGFASPEFRYAAAYLDEPEKALAVIRKQVDGFDETLKGTDFADDHLEAIRRVQEDVRQFIGEGPAAGKVRALATRGAVKTDDGEIIRAGTVEAAQWMHKMYDEKKWLPGKTKLHVSSGEYLPVGSLNLPRAFADWTFRWIYTKPDLALARHPTWRSMATQEYRRLIQVGYDVDTAKELARAYAARGVSDMMFTIGAKTTGEYFLRNISPFFPAYRELFNTWLFKVPNRMGSGVWALGALQLTRRAQVWMQFFENVGWVKRDENGELTTPLPFLRPILSAFLGDGVLADTPTGSMLGLFPLPQDFFETDEDGNPLGFAERMRGGFPSVGGNMGLIIAGLNNLTDGWLDDVEEFVAPYGTDNSQGPRSVDLLLEAFGITPQWMTGSTSDLHEAIKVSAVMDGMRLSQDEYAPADWTEYDADGDGQLLGEEAENYWRDNSEGLAEWVAAGERYATKLYLYKAGFASTMPFSVSISNEDKDLAAAMWALINSMPEDDSFASAVIQGFKAEYDIEPYLVRKTEDTRAGKVGPTDDIDEFYEFVRSGEIKFPNQTDWAVFALGMNSYSLHQERIDAIYREAGNDAGEWMLNFDAKGQVAEERAKWKYFLQLSEDYDPTTDQTKSFAQMFDRYQELKRIHEGDKPLLTLEQERLLDFDAQMREYALKLAPGEPSSDNYFKMREAAYNALGEPTTDIGKGVAWAFENVFDPYYARLDELYSKLDTLDEWEEGPIYQKIRKWSDRYNKTFKNPDHPEWGTFPSPEKYYFKKLDEGAQRRRISDWAALPANFLTAFQREQVGYSIPPKKQDDASKLMDMLAAKERKTAEYVERNQTSYSAQDVIDMQAEDKADLAKKAKEMGLEKFWKELNQPEYKRIDMAHGLSERNPVWKELVGVVDSLITGWGRADIKLSGTTAEAKVVHTWLADTVRTLRRHNADFDSIMLDLTYALSDDENPLGPDDLALKLFFDVFDTSNAFYLNKAANTRMDGEPPKTKKEK